MSDLDSLPNWTGALLSPLAFHLTGLALIGIITSKVRIKNNKLRALISLTIFTFIAILAFLKTSRDQNLFRLLRSKRNPTVRDIQHGLDRLESLFDEETVAEWEEKLTGKSAAYFLKGIIEVTRP